jgi:hypothetical protein
VHDSFIHETGAVPHLSADLFAYTVDWSRRSYLGSYNGVLWIQHEVNDSPTYFSDRVIPTGWQFSSESGSELPRWGNHWFRVSQESGAGASTLYIQVPHWALVRVTAILPGRAFWLFLRRRYRLGRGQCSSCGYDLRASQNRCPECGMPITQKLGALE